MTESSPLAVVLLNWNDFQQTLDCISRLRSCENISQQLDIFVVDNGSSDGSVDIISKKYPEVHLLSSDKNLGFSGGNNLALQKICFSGEENKTYDYVLLLNTDAGIGCSHLQTLLFTLQQCPDIGVLGPVFTTAENDPTILYAGGRDPSRYINTYRRAKKDQSRLKDGKPFSVDYVSGTVALIRVAALRKSGLFAEEYFFSGEMADLCERIKSHFICAVAPQVRAWHNMEKSDGRRNTLYLYYILRNRFLFIRRCKRKYLALLFLYWAVICVVFMSKSLLVMKFDVARAIGLALRDGLSARYGGRNELFVDA